jgi:glycosyltransferase involved in cell wall biosynthesis
MAPALSIILPCYNEEGNIPLILETFRKKLVDRNDIEVLLVNNGSTDDSKTVFNRELVKKENAFAHLVNIDENRGYGFGIMEGVRQAQGDLISWTHADMQTDPEDVLEGYEQLLAYGDRNAVLKGRRIARGYLDSFFTFGMSIISSIALNQKLYDINAQPKIFYREFLSILNNPPDDFSLDLYLLYKARKTNHVILEKQVSFHDRIHGEAKGGGTMKGKLKLIMRTWNYILKLKQSLKQDQ